MPPFNNFTFTYLFGWYFTNEINNGNGVSPLSLLPRSERRALTNDEREDYNRMTIRGPKLYQGVIPHEGEGFPDVADARTTSYLRVNYTIVRYNNGRIHCFALGFKFTSIRQCETFIQDYNIKAATPRIKGLLQGSRNKLTRRIRAHKICSKFALECYYNGRAVHGTTVTMFRRRHLTNKVDV